MHVLCTYTRRQPLTKESGAISFLLDPGLIHDCHHAIVHGSGINTRTLEVFPSLPNSLCALDPHHFYTAEENHHVYHGS